MPVHAKSFNRWTTFNMSPTEIKNRKPCVCMHKFDIHTKSFVGSFEADLITAVINGQNPSMQCAQSFTINGVCTTCKCLGFKEMDNLQYVEFCDTLRKVGYHGKL